MSSNPPLAPPLAPNTIGGASDASSTSIAIPGSTVKSVQQVGAAITPTAVEGGIAHIYHLRQASVAPTNLPAPAHQLPSQQSPHLGTSNGAPSVPSVQSRPTRPAAPAPAAQPPNSIPITTPRRRTNWNDVIISNNELSKLREHHRHIEQLELLKATNNEKARNREVELALLKNQQLQLQLNILQHQRQGDGSNAPASQ